MHFIAPMTSRYQRLLKAVVLAGLCVCLGCTNLAPTPDAAIHPVFHTPVTASTAARPAAQVDVLDASEAWFFSAELYLAVQSSRFPQGTWVLLPINQGDFEGCMKRFIQLPFEIAQGDTLIFNLLDDDKLTSSQEALIVSACRTSGYCVVAAGSVYSGGSTQLIAPVATEAAGVLGEAIVDDFRLHRFQNLGTAEFTAVMPLPSHPHEANRLTLLDNSNYARLQLKLYGPHEPLALNSTSRGAETHEDDEAGAASEVPE